MLPHFVKGEPKTAEAFGQRIRLPLPRQDGEVAIERALLQRRSVREYSDEPLKLSELSQLLWAAQGVTDPSGLRTAPSAGALYPLELYLVAGRVADLPEGVYKYEPQRHELLGVVKGDKRGELCRAAIFQLPVRDAPAVVVLSAVYERTTVKYGERGIRYVHMEAGHAAQNLLLQAVSLRLGAVVIGAFYDDQVRQVLRLGGRERPLYLIPVGKK